MIQEFIKFVKATNAIALAIGVIIAGAAGKLIDAIVADLLNPILGVILGGINGGITLTNALMIPLGTTVNEKGEEVLNAIKIGDMISVLINFLIVMFVVFIIARKFAPSVVAPK